MTIWTIKIGSALLTENGRTIAAGAINAWARQIVALKQHCNIDTVLVTSGAVAGGMQQLGLPKRPNHMHVLRAAAAVGQLRVSTALMQAFTAHNSKSAQILLTHEDLRNRHRYLNARSTIQTLLSLGVVPIVNENDAITTEEIEFGDNDTLAALTVNLIGAERLVILTDQDGLYDKDPRHHNDAVRIETAHAEDDTLLHTVSATGGTLGRGGMATKVRAARFAARSGAHTVICNGNTEDILLRLGRGEKVGTEFVAATTPLAARKQWLCNTLKIRGTITVDAGAVRALRTQGGSLLPIGITAVSGDFERGDVVCIIDENGIEHARGLVNYNADSLNRIKRCRSEVIKQRLGTLGDTEAVHRDNMVLNEL